jgi:predicted dehydrogenase
LAEADEMIQLAREKNLFFGIMQNRRFLKQIRAYRQLIADGTIGTPGYLGADFFLGPHFGGFREVMASPLLLDMAIHTFDQARFILRANATAVYCQEFNPPGSWYTGNASAIAIFTMSDGSVFCYRGSWCSVGCPTSWEAEWRASGSIGTAIWDGRSMPWAEVLTAGQADTAEAPDCWMGREGHDGCLDELFDALLSGRPAETDAADNRNSLAMVMAAIESARTGVRVSMI